MAIFGNFKGTTKSEFQIGKNGNRISTGSQPTTDISNGDLFIDNANAQLQIYSNAWIEVGSTLASLNVDNGTLTVDAANDTVSIGSAASNEKLFVNGNLRLGTNPSLQHSGAYLDLRHSNGSTSQVRVRDNGSNTDPIFKIFDADNTNEVFKVQGDTVRIQDAYNLPVSDGTANQVLSTDGSGTLSFATVNANPDGSNTDVQFNDGDSFNGLDSFTFDKATSTLKTGIIQAVIFEHITDYGSIADTANMIMSFGSVTESANTLNYEYIKDISGPTSDAYTVNNLPDSSVAGQMIFVSDEAGGSVMAFSDGSNWRRITDRQVVS